MIYYEIIKEKMSTQKKNKEITLSNVLSSHLNHLHPHPHCWNTSQQDKYCTFTPSPCVHTILPSLSIFFFSTFLISTFLLSTFCFDIFPFYLFKAYLSTKLQCHSFIYIQLSVDHLPIIQKSITGVS